MTELRNVEADLSRFRGRVLVASAAVLVCFLLLVSRLVYLQVVKHEELDEQAEANRTAIVPIVPNRGLILDRNGIVLASNYSAYTLEITPAVEDLEATIDELADRGNQPATTAASRSCSRRARTSTRSRSDTKLTTRRGALHVQRFRFPASTSWPACSATIPGRARSHAIGYIGRSSSREEAEEDWPEDVLATPRHRVPRKLGVEQS